MKTFITPGKINLGTDIFNESKKDLAKLGHKALIVADPYLIKSGEVAKLQEVLASLNIKSVIDGEIVGEPTDIMIMSGVNLYTIEHCDFLIGFGGGSPLDSMKAIGAVIVSGGDIDDYYGREFTKKLPPMVAIPTTAGTGSEATKFTIISNTKDNIKMLLKGDTLLPDLVLIDPTFSITTPKNVTSSTGIDAFCHAMESFTSRKRQPIASTLALSAVKRIYQNLLVAYKDGQNIATRNEMAIAALEAGMSFTNSSVTLIHGMSRPIGALYHVPHGLSNAMLLPTCLDFLLDGDHPGFATLGKSIGVATNQEDDKSAAMAFKHAVTKLCIDLEIPTLKEYGVNETSFMANLDKMAQDALDSGSPANSMREVNKEDIIKIYKSLWK